MSDPISNDYAAVLALSEQQERRAVLTLACLNGRARKPKESDASFAEMLAMLGLTETAWEIVGRPQPAAPTRSPLRNAYGRSRPDLAPKTAPPGRVCRTAGHDMSPGSPNVYVDPTTGKLKCRECRQISERARRVKEKQNRPVITVDPDLCRCPGERHRLHTAPNGRRYCPVATLKRQRANRAKARGEQPEPLRSVPTTPGMCRAGIHPRRGPGRCQDCKNDRKREKTARERVQREAEAVREGKAA